MIAIEPLFAQPAAQAVALALLHFIWQGAAIGLFTALALALLRRSAADIRYVVASIGLTLMLTMPVVTAVQTWRAGGAHAATSSGVHETSVAASARPAADRRAGIVPATRDRQELAESQREWRLDAWLPMLLTGWMSGVLVLTVRLMSGWVWVQRMKSRGTTLAPAGIQALAARLARRLHIRRRVTFLESALVDVPTVIGWMQPVVLVPASALAGLSPQQLEAILAHELAHIRRHDYLVNLLQTLVETLLFYHPAVWWLSRRIRLERENCCDDLAVALCGDPVWYARALADLESLRSVDRFALSATGGSLVQRVRRLLGAPSHAGRGPGWLAGTAAILVMAAVAAGALRADDEGARGELRTRVQDGDSPRAFTTHARNGGSGAGVTTARGAAPHSTGAEAGRQAEARSQEPAASIEAAREGYTDRARAAQGAAGPLAASAADPEQAADLAPEAAHAETAPAEAVVAATAARGDSIPTTRQRGNLTWSNGKEKLRVSYEGEVEFTDDDADVKSLSPGGWLKISEGGLFATRSVEFRADHAGNLTRRFSVGSSDRSFEPEGRQWLAQTLPRFIRQSGIGASSRVARILRARGTEGVLEEIALIEGSWARRTYYQELLEQNEPDGRALAQIITRAGRDLDSDFELATLLIASAERLLADDAARKAYFEAAGSIDSDFEMRRVFSAALERGPLDADSLAQLLDTSAGIASDFEEASLLIQIAKLQPLEGQARGPFFRAVGTIASDFERRRVLSAVLSRPDVTAETLVAVLDAGAPVASDFEGASLLLDVLKRHSVEGPVRQAFFRVVAGIDSSFERGRVLQTIARRADASDETVLDILRAAQAMKSTFETSQVLLALAEHQALSAEAREIYIDIAGRLGDFEQGRALTALVRNERGKKLETGSRR